MDSLVRIIAGSLAGIGLALCVVGILKTVEEPEEKQPNVKISACDSLHLANDSLVHRIEVLDRRVRQYEIGLMFLKDKDKQAYDYVINAGNLDFPLEYEKSY